MKPLEKSLMNACPECGSQYTRRIPRTLFQRVVLVNSRRILCSNCGERSLVLWPGFFQRTERPIVRDPGAGRRALY
jgi:DNA-directed RNA polymerase subunit RPC12/RpoP